MIALGLLSQVLGLPAEHADPAQWNELGVATLVIWGTVEMLRRSIFKNLDGIAVNVFAAAVGVTLAVAFGVAGIITGSILDWLVFGVQATFFATIGDLLAKKAGQGKQLPAPEA